MGKVILEQNRKHKRRVFHVPIPKVFIVHLTYHLEKLKYQEIKNIKNQEKNQEKIQASEGLLKGILVHLQRGPGSNPVVTCNFLLLMLELVLPLIAHLNKFISWYDNEYLQHCGRKPNGVQGLQEVK